MLFLVSNTGIQTHYRWTQKVQGPGGIQMGLAITGSSMASATRVGYDVLRLTLDQYTEGLIEFRCGLSPARVRALRGTLKGWECKDLKLFVGQINFGQLPQEDQDALNKVPTRLKLETEQVDMVIDAAVQATRQSADFNGFLRTIGAVDTPDTPRRITPNARRILPSGG